jgi:hypothetical protein
VQVDLFEDGEPLDEGERTARIEVLKHDLAEIEIRRRFLHERIDLLRAERVRRLGRLRRAGLLAVERPSPVPRRRLFTGKGEVSTEPLGGLPDLASIGDDELHALIRFFKSLEDDVSLQRRVLHYRIDALPG